MAFEREVGEGAFKTNALDHIQRQEDEMALLESVLKELVEACTYVSPIVGAVATKPSVKDIRNASRFVQAFEAAKAVLTRK